jgi:hypothetical protein
MALFFSDMLGDHNLIAGAELSTSLTGDSDFKDLGGVVGYQNLKHRWNWATTFAQQPYRSGTVQAFTALQAGEPVVFRTRSFTDRLFAHSAAWWPIRSTDRSEWSSVARSRTWPSISSCCGRRSR